MFKGKFKATFIGNVVSKRTLSNEVDTYIISEFNNFKCLESARIREDEFTQIKNNHNVMRIDRELNTNLIIFPLSSGIEVRHQIDWQSFIFFNPEISSIYKVDREFTYTEASLRFLKAFLRFFYLHKFWPKQLAQESTEICVGYVEASFACKIVNPE